MIPKWQAADPMWPAVLSWVASLPQPLGNFPHWRSPFNSSVMFQEENFVSCLPHSHFMRRITETYAERHHLIHVVLRKDCVDSPNTDLYHFSLRRRFYSTSGWLFLGFMLQKAFSKAQPSSLWMQITEVSLKSSLRNRENNFSLPFVLKSLSDGCY